MKFLLYEVRMKWWLKDLWESVESREDLYQELLRAIPFKGETEVEFKYFQSFQYVGLAFSIQ